MDRLCRHCHRLFITRPRALCRGCYYRAGVRDLYPCGNSKYGRRGTCPDRAGSRDILPAEATDARPGTAAKLAVMHERARRGEALHHPHDARLQGDVAMDRLYRLLLGVNHEAA